MLCFHLYSQMWDCVVESGTKIVFCTFLFAHHWISLTIQVFFFCGFFLQILLTKTNCLSFLSKKMDYFAFSLNFMRPIQIMVVQIHHIKNSDGLIYLDKILLSLSFNSVEILLNLYQTTRNSLPSTK